MGKFSREKGKRGEREAAELLRSHGYEGKRGVQYCGKTGEADVTGLPGVHLEVKRTERLNIYGAVRQATEDARDGEEPVVLHRKNGERWLAVMTAETFFAIYERGKRNV